MTRRCCCPAPTRSRSRAPAGCSVLLPPEDEGRRKRVAIDLVDGSSWPAGRTTATYPTATRSRSRSAGALDHDVPLLGVCRGMQVMNLARGGTLIEHLRTFSAIGSRLVPARSATTTSADRGLAGRSRGGKLTARPSRTMIGRRVIGEGLEMTGSATVDDLPGRSRILAAFALGDQWHPRRKRHGRDRRWWSRHGAARGKGVRDHGRGRGSAPGGDVVRRRGRDRRGVDLREDFEGVDLALAADVSSEEDVLGFLARAGAEYGRIDVLFNNAGISPTTTSPSSTRLGGLAARAGREPRSCSCAASTASRICWTAAGGR